MGLFLAFVGCNQNSQKQKGESTAEANAVEEINGSEVTACQHASKIYWTGTKPGGEHKGIIKISKGNYIVENDELIGGEFTINMNSIVDIDIDDEAMNAKLVNHLKSADFFNVDSFPEGKFIITAVNKIEDDIFSHEIAGNLTLKSITHPISFKANVKVGDGKVSATSEDVVLDRTLWGIKFKSKSVFKELKDKFIDDNFTVKIEAHSM